MVQSTLDKPRPHRVKLICHVQEAARGELPSFVSAWNTSKLWIEPWPWRPFLCSATATSRLFSAKDQDPPHVLLWPSRASCASSQQGEASGDLSWSDVSWLWWFPVHTAPLPSSRHTSSMRTSSWTLNTTSTSPTWRTPRRSTEVGRCTSDPVVGNASLSRWADLFSGPVWPQLHWKGAATKMFLHQSVTSAAAASVVWAPWGGLCQNVQV